jgi:tetratricopeptide (TPR) repeat protein
MIKTIAVFAAQSLAQYALDKKLDSFFNPKEDAHIDALKEVIIEALNRYEKVYPQKDQNGRFAFYKSEIIITELLKFRIFGNRDAIDPESLQKAFAQNVNIEKPTKGQLELFITYFHEALAANPQLSILEKQHRFPEKIYEIAAYFEEFLRLLNSQNKKLEDISDALINIHEDVKKSNTQNPSTKLSHKLTLNPIFPDVFLGRTQDLQKIRDRLTQGETFLLLVNGDGGIGKSTLAATYYQKFGKRYQHIAWLVNETDIASTLLQLAPELGLSFEPTTPPQERWELLLKKLASLPHPCLFVLDNTNRLADLEKYYPALRSLSNIHILITSRIRGFAEELTFKIDGLLEKDALQLFKTYYKRHKKEDDALLKEVIRAVNHNTLIIELLAKNLQAHNQFHQQYHLNQLLSDIQTSLLKLRHSKVIKTMYQVKSTESFKKATVEEIVGAMYKLEKLNEDEKQLASVFAILPLEAIPFKLLHAFLNEAPIEESLNALVTRGWIEHDTEAETLKVNQVVQEVVKNQQSTRLETDAVTLIENITQWLFDEQSFHKDRINITRILARYAENVVTALKKQPSESYLSLLNAIGNLFSNSGDLFNAGAYYQQFQEDSKKLFENQPENTNLKNGLAISYSKLGETHAALGNLDTALDFYEKDATISKELYEDYPNQVSYKNGLAISYSKLGETHAALGNLDTALDFYKKQSLLFESLYEDYPNQVSYKNGLAISYSKLGQTHAALGNLDTALDFYKKQSLLFESLYEDYPNQVSFKNGLAISYSKLGQTHAALGNLDTALDFYKKQSLLFESLYEDYPNQVSFKNGLAISYSKLGETHAALGNLDTALDFYEKDATISKELYEDYPNQVSYKNGLAISYEKLGETHAALGNLDTALDFYKKQSLLFESLYEDYPNQVSFKNGLAISYSKLGQTHAALGNLDTALDFYEKDATISKELYEDYPNQVSFKNGLAIALAKLGVFYMQQQPNPQKAKAYFLKAKSLWEELIIESPAAIEYQRNLENVKTDLEKLNEN